MPERSTAKAPAGLLAAGRELWRAIHAAMPAAFELDERELAILRLACGQADDVAALERALKDGGVVVAGSQGQSRLNAVVGELRQARIAVSRLLGEIELPAADEEPRSAGSRRAQRAAQVRWAEHAARRRDRG